MPHYLFIWTIHSVWNSFLCSMSTSYSRDFFLYWCSFFAIPKYFILQTNSSRRCTNWHRWSMRAMASTAFQRKGIKWFCFNRVCKLKLVVLRWDASYYLTWCLTWCGPTRRRNLTIDESFKFVGHQVSVQELSEMLLCTLLFTIESSSFHRLTIYLMS